MKIYKLANNKKIYIMRGVSGSGKSTVSRSLPGVKSENIFGTDELIADNIEDYNVFFDSMQKNEDWAPLDAKHKELIDLIGEAMEEGRSPLVLDNMNLAAWECKSAIQKAISNGYAVEFVDVGTGGLTAEELTQRNKHNVPMEMVQKMIDKYEDEGELTVEKVLNSEIPEEHSINGKD